MMKVKHPTHAVIKHWGQGGYSIFGSASMYLMVKLNPQRFIAQTDVRHYEEEGSQTLELKIIETKK